MDFRERERKKKKTLIGCLRYTPQPGVKLAAQVGTLTRNWTPNILGYGMLLQPTEPHLPELHLDGLNKDFPDDITSSGLKVMLNIACPYQLSPPNFSFFRNPWISEGQLFTQLSLPETQG